MQEVTILVFYDCIEHNPNLLLNKARTCWGTDKFILKYQDKDRTIHNILKPLYDRCFIWRFGKYNMVNDKESDDILPYLFDTFDSNSYYFLAPSILDDRLDDFTLEDAEIKCVELNCDLKKEQKKIKLLTKDNTLYTQVLRKCCEEKIETALEKLPLNVRRDYSFV